MRRSKGYRLGRKVHQPDISGAKSEGNPSTHEDACEGGEEATDQGRRQRERMDAKGRVGGAGSCDVRALIWSKVNVDILRGTRRNACSRSGRDGVLRSSERGQLAGAVSGQSDRLATSGRDDGDRMTCCSWRT